MIAFELVTADGTQRRVTKDENSELFYLLRGGGKGGNLGIVTAMEFHLFPGSDLFAGGLYYDGEHAAAVLEQFSDWVTSLPPGGIGVVGFPAVAGHGHRSRAAAR